LAPTSAQPFNQPKLKETKMTKFNKNAWVAQEFAKVDATTWRGRLRSEEAMIEFANSVTPEQRAAVPYADESLAAHVMLAQKIRQEFA
jgi:hypothetical protein